MGYFVAVAFPSKRKGEHWSLMAPILINQVLKASGAVYDCFASPNAGQRDVTDLWARQPNLGLPTAT